MSLSKVNYTIELLRTGFISKQDANRILKFLCIVWEHNHAVVLKKGLGCIFHVHCKTVSRNGESIITACKSGSSPICIYCGTRPLLCSEPGCYNFASIGGVFCYRCLEDTLFKSFGARCI